MPISFASVVSAEDRHSILSRAFDFLYTGITLTVDSTEMEVHAGDDVNFTFHVRNHGQNTVQIRDLTAALDCSGWSANLSPEVAGASPEVTVEPYGTLDGVLTLHAPEGASISSACSAEITVSTTNTSGVERATVTARVVETVRVSLDLTPPFADVTPGDTVQLIIYLKNRGNTDVWVNLSAAAEGMPAEIERDSVLLTVGQEESLGLSVHIPDSLTAGNHTVEVTAADSAGHVQSTASVLRVRQYYGVEIINAYAKNGGRIMPGASAGTVVVYLKNTGNGEDRITITVDAEFPDAEHWNLTNTSVVLAPGERRNVSLTFMAWSRAQGGSYVLRATATSEGGVSDSAYFNVTVVRPDVYVTSESIDPVDTPTAGLNCTLSIRVFNAGEVDAEDVSLVLYDGGTALWNTTVPLVRAGGHREVFYTWVPASRGYHQLELVVDPDDRLIEMNENNNSVIKSVAVYQPNPSVDPEGLSFIVGGVTVTHTTPGTGVYIVVHITNMDELSAKASRLVVRIYVDDERIEEKVLTVNANDDAYVETLWTAEKGTHEIKAVLDPDNLIYESDEEDNQVVKQITVVEEESSGNMFVLAVAAACALGVAYGLKTGVIPRRPRGLRKAARTLVCSECGKKIKKGRIYYQCSCGRDMHKSCAKRYRYCKCYRKVKF